MFQDLAQNLSSMVRCQVSDLGIHWYSRTWAGNFGQLFDPDGWNFHRYLANTYSGVVKINGLWGVSDLDFHSNIIQTPSMTREGFCWSRTQRLCTMLLLKSNIYMKRPVPLYSKFVYIYKILALQRLISNYVELVWTSCCLEKAFWLHWVCLIWNIVSPEYYE